MSKDTNIEWATHTFNPWIGCTKVSPGCANCYAETMDRNRFSRTMDGGTPAKPVPHWGRGAPRHRTKGWSVPLRWDSECGVHPGYRARVFPSLCDWLDDEVPVEWLADFLKLIHDTPELDWLLLTKRPENWRERLCAVWRSLIVADKTVGWTWLSAWESGTAPANVWVGVSVEDQKRADQRIPELLRIPAKVRFLSVEPLLEAVNIKDALRCDVPVHWVIVGGESGQGRRDCGVEAICNVVRQCGGLVPCFVKQDCAAKPGQQGRIPGAYWAVKEFPEVAQ